MNLSETVLCLSWVYADADRRAGKIYAGMYIQSLYCDVCKEIVTQDMKRTAKCSTDILIRILRLSFPLSHG